MLVIARRILRRPNNESGFTIVELLIVIVVIGILAAITIVAYSGITARAQVTKMQSDLATFSKAIQVARIVSQKTLIGITGSTYTAGSCVSKTAGTDLAALPSTDPCWTSYASALDNISSASGINIRNLLDPWGRPYFLDENEGENGTSCILDVIAAYSQPVNGGTRYPNTQINILLSGLSGCAV